MLRQSFGTGTPQIGADIGRTNRRVVVTAIELHERTVTVGGYEYADGPVHIKVMPRTFRIREYEDSQIHLRVLVAFALGFALGVAPTLVSIFQ